MAIEFTKYHGLGNDFILIDNRASAEPRLSPEDAVQWCDRHFGIGADGVIFALPGQDGTDYTMRIFNNDGSEPEMCGNGIRCLAKFIAELEGITEPRSYKIQTLGGLITPKLEANGLVTVDMGKPRLLAAEIPTTLVEADRNVVNQPLEVGGKTWHVTCVNMGNPHCVTFIDDVAAMPLETLGSQFETHPVFPKKINVEFVQVVRPDYLKMRVWERAAGITLACGTGACASLVAGVLTKRCVGAASPLVNRRATVELPGGLLQIEWSEADDRLYMTGPAQKAFVGTR